MSTRRAARPRWALQDAKNRFSEVVEAALQGQPQVVTRRGVDTAVVLSHDQFMQLSGGTTGRGSFADYLLDTPRIDGEPFERIRLRPRTGF